MFKLDKCAAVKSRQDVAAKRSSHFFFLLLQENIILAVNLDTFGEENIILAAILLH